MGKSAQGSFVLTAALVALISPPASWGGGPTVFWASTPVQPGEAVLLYGDGLEKADEIRISRLADEPPGFPVAPYSSQGVPPNAAHATPLQPSPVSVKHILPKELQPGVFTVWVHTPGGLSSPVLLNRPAIWWIQGDAGPAATPGGWIRVFGTTLGWPDGQFAKARVALEAGGRWILLRIGETGTYSLKATLPRDLAEGHYQVWMHNGRGGPRAWSASSYVQIQRARQWPVTVFDVRSFGAAGDGMRDDTEAIQRALEKAGRNGGGVVYFPRGLYKIASTLKIPPMTILRGQRQDLVDLFWPDTTALLPTVLQGTHSFGIDDLTLHFSLAQHGIVADEEGPHAGSVFLRRVRAHWLLYAGHLTPEIVDQRLREALRLSSGGGDLVRLTGSNVEVTDCDLYSSGRVLVLRGVEGALIARNSLYNGRWGWYSISGGERIIFERNQIAGGDLMATGGGVNSLGEMPSSQYIYFADNTLKNFSGWDREALTTDGGGGEYIGLLASATPTTVTYPASQGWQPDTLRLKVAYIVSGKGKGQFRRIISNTDQTLTVDRAWDVVPDSSSLVGITWMRGHYLFVGNEVIDAGIAIQLYGVAFDSLIAQNRSIRAGGFRSHAARYLGNYNAPITQGIQPQMFIQYLDNEIVEGSSYHMGANPGSALDVQAFAPSREWKWPMALGFILRRNKLYSHARLRLLTDGEGATLIEDAVVERNQVRDSPIGLEVGARSARVLLHDNAFVRVETPLVDRSHAALQSTDRSDRR